jgi:uncharacterized membrane protein
MVRPRKHLKHPLAAHVDENAIAAALHRAEQATAARLAVVVAPHGRHSIQSAAQRTFQRLRLGHDPHNPGVLIYIVPSRREFAVWGGAAAHERIGQAFWDSLVAFMKERIAQAGLTAGVIEGISCLERELSRHFPPPPRA